MKKILIYEASSLQALALSKFIKNYSNYHITGVINQNIIFNRINYDIIRIEQNHNINIDEFDYILPMGANITYKVINKYRQLNYCNSIKFIDKNLIVYDKIKMLAIAKSLNIPIPKTYLRIDKIEKYPIFFKEDFEQGGGSRGVADCIGAIPDGNLLYQEYINTPATYGVGFLAIDGEIKTYTVHKEILSFPEEGGSAVVLEKFNDERLIEYTSKLVKELKYNGWGLSEFKYCENRDKYFFMEINAKFWASIEFILKNNPTFLKLILNIEYKIIPTPRVIYINRLLQYKLINVMKYFHYISSSTIIKEYSISYQIIRNLMPDIIVNLLKKLIK